MSITFAPEENNTVVRATRRASVNGPAHIDGGAFFLLCLIETYTAAAVLNDLVSTRETYRHWVVFFNGTGSRLHVVSRGMTSGKYQRRGMAAHGRPDPATPTCPMSKSMPTRRKGLGVFFRRMVKKSAKSFGVVQKSAIFAASKLQMRYECRRKYPAIFVPSLYWIHRITMPCRVSGNRPGGLAFGALTARSMVTFLCQKQMQIRKENVPAFTLLTWREMFCHFLRKWQEWKSSENVWFTAWCGERVTNGECASTAIVVCLVFPAMLCLLGLVLEGGAV